MKIEYVSNQKKEEDIYLLYEKLEWNEFLQISQQQLIKAMKQSFYIIYAYDEEKLVGTGRVISDGIINAYICGLGVLPQYRKNGIGTKMIQLLIGHCKKHNTHIELFCEEELVPLYNNLGFEVFAVGLKFHS